MPFPPAKAQGIADQIAAKIRRGDYLPGSWLPSERELSEEYQANRSTIRNAIKFLANDGLASHVHGQGVRVIEPEDADLTAQIAHWPGILASELEPVADTSVDEIPASAEIARAIGIPTGERLLRRTRVHGAAGEPVTHMSIAYLPWEVVELIPHLAEPNAGPDDTYARLALAGRPVATFEDAVTCRLPTQDERNRLVIGATEPVLTIFRRAFDRRGRIIEVTNLVVVGSRRERIYRYDANE